MENQRSEKPHSGTFLGYRDEHGNEMHCANAFCPHPDKCNGGCSNRVARIAPPMSDLVERLRAHMGKAEISDVLTDCREAASEIERLREQAVKAHGALKEILAEVGTSTRANKIANAGLRGEK